MDFVLVFYLLLPENFTAYSVYKTESECIAAMKVWQSRLDKVKSKLVAECREQVKEN
jgi:hypothetical protein